MLWGKDKAPTHYNTYDGSIPGARTLAMGYAFCAVGEEPSAIYFNPAGIYFIKSNLFSMTYEATRQSDLTTEEIFSPEALRNKNLVFLGITSPQGAFSWRPLADYTTRTDSGADWLETEIKINALTFSVSAEHDSKTYSGLNVSYLNGRIAESRVENNIPNTNIADGHGITCDFGIIHSLSEEFRFGVNLQNLCGFIWWDDYRKDQLPFILRTGMAFQITNFLTFASDWEKRYYREGTEGPVEVTHFGVEQNIGKILKFQLGSYGQDLNNKEKSHLTGGVTYYRNKYKLSLAGEKYRIDGADVNRYLFSLDIPI